ncbi:MAG: DUF429 domain-containing protein [Actinophytocola sp.]|nr:DUF429 domain-containing protein [Actinophytocola sp.]
MGGEAGRHAAVDDVLDAGAAAWTAARVATGTAMPLPNPPVEYADGWHAASWAGAVSAAALILSSRRGRMPGRRLPARRPRSPVGERPRPCAACAG